MNPEFAQNRLGVRSHRMPGDAKAQRDLFVGELLAHQAEHDSLLFGQEHLTRARLAHQVRERANDLHIGAAEAAKRIAHRLKHGGLGPCREHNSAGSGGQSFDLQLVGASSRTNRMRVPGERVTSSPANSMPGASAICQSMIASAGGIWAAAIKASSNVCAMKGRSGGAARKPARPAAYAGDRLVIRTGTGEMLTSSFLGVRAGEAEGAGYAPTILYRPYPG